MSAKHLSLQRAAWAAAVAATVSVVTQAGSVYVAPVKFQPDANGGGYVEGAMGYVRNSESTLEYIGCRVQRRETKDANGQPVRTQLVTCSARDAAGTSVSCTSTSLDLARALGAATSDSILGFNYDSSGACTAIQVYESSSMTPKK